MLLAGSTDLDTVLAELAGLRPVFHSEADFQLALAWQVQQRDPSLLVRLETRPAPGVHLDLAFASPRHGQTTAVELKYLTRAWVGDVDGERYELKDHGAQDVRAYDVVKDVARVERFLAGKPGANGAVVVFTNDPSYWRPAKEGDTSNAAAFRIGEGVELTGTRIWGPDTGLGTMKGRTSVLDVAGRYELHWTDYSRLHAGGRGSEFRQLVIPIASSS